MNRPDVLIVGAGLSGLACALALQKRGVSFQIVEAGEQPGGRFRTDTVEGFRLDRGFHFLLTASPEAEAVFDYDALKLFRFESGARVWQGKGFRRAGSLGGFRDKLRLSAMMRDLRKASIEELMARPDLPAVESLRRRLFTQEIINTMFRPWLGALLADTRLGCSSRRFEFLFKMLLDGDAVTPAGGIQALPDQLAGRLPRGAIRYGARVHSITRNHVRLTTGERLTGEAVVVATEGAEASAMLPQVGRILSRSLTCVYYTAKQPPHRNPSLIVDGLGQGIVSHLAVLSEVASGYAPNGQALISVTMPGIQSRNDGSLDTFLRGHLGYWYGGQVSAWRLLKVYRLANFVPQMTTPLDLQRPGRVAPGIYVCGDYRSMPSVHGALESGRRVAAEVLADAKDMLRTEAA